MLEVYRNGRTNKRNTSIGGDIFWRASCVVVVREVWIDILCTGWGGALSYQVVFVGFLVSGRMFLSD